MSGPGRRPRERDDTQRVRLRLALGHVVALAFALLAFAAATYGYIAHSTLERTDTALADAVPAFVAGARPEPGERADAPAQLREAASEWQSTGRLFVYDGSGGRLAASGVDPHDAGPAPSAVDQVVRARSRGRLSIRVTLPGPDGGHRLLLAPIRIAGQPYVIAASQSLQARAATLASLRLGFGVAIPVALLLSGLAGYVLARRSLAPVVRMAAQQRRFMADAAHELRTPVAILRAESDVALERQDRSPEAYRDSIRLVRDQGLRLSRVVEDLFLLARADAGHLPLRGSELYLGDLAQECARAVRTLAAARGARVDVDVTDDAPFFGDEALLHRLLLNLVDNAVKYAPPGARVTVSVARAGDTYRVGVSDTGPAIPAAVRARIFDRFYRGADGAAPREDAPGSGSESGARPRGGTGAGLGLAIARWIAEAHGGWLQLAPPAAAGNEFVLSLPAAG